MSSTVKQPSDIVVCEESRFQKAEKGKAIEFTPLTSCATVTCRLMDDSLIAGHFVISKEKEIPGLLKGMNQARGGKKVKEMVVVGPIDFWNESNVKDKSLHGYVMVATFWRMLGCDDETKVRVAKTPGKGERPQMMCAGSSMAVVDVKTGKPVVGFEDLDPDDFKS